MQQLNESSSSSLSPLLNMPFCGSEFWNSNLTWYTETPYFTRCFQSTVLVYLPSLVCLLLTPLDLYNYSKSESREVPWGPRLKARLGITILLAGFSIAELVLTVLDLNTELGTVFPADTLAAIIKSLTFLLSSALLLTSRHFGQVNSGTQFFFWLSSCFCQGLTMGSLVISRSSAEIVVEDTRSVYEILYSVTLALSLVMLLLNFFADDQPLYSDLMQQIEDNPSPKRAASFPSRLVFGWFESLIVRGWKKPLTQSDLWNLSPEDSYQKIVPFWESKLYIKNSDSKECESGKPEISILVPMVKCFWPYYIVAGFFQIGYIGFELVNPQIISVFIEFVEEKQEYWKGYLYMTLFGMTSLMIALTDTRYWNSMELLSMRVYTAITTSIYKKSLTLSSKSRNEYTAGEVVNLMAVDAEKVKESVKFITFIWSAPLQVALTIYFIWQIIGPSVLVGLAVLLLCLPLNGLAWYSMESYQKKQMKQKDVRVNMVNEILNGIKVLKLYAWEKSFIQKINEIRQSEISALKMFQYLEGTQFLMWNCAPFLVAIGSFASYVLIDPVNNILDPQKAFVSLTLFNTLQAPLALLPYGVVSIIQGAVSIKRINKYLNAEEIDPNNVTHDRMGSSVLVKNASFTWGTKKDMPTLKNLYLSVKENSLVAVVGKVGSGKSSLLSALLGEMSRTNGFANVEGSVAYVSQQAWMRNMSLKNNILFGKPYNEKLYEKVIESCALKPDLLQLPGGDGTEIGEKGINLSGGQKQRINLARAVYANKDVYFFDDPLSAVDAHVGKHIFDKVIGPKGVLRKKTRILVTHGITYLPFTDNIIVLKNGTISEYGAYDDLLNKQGDFADFIVEQLQKAEEDSASETEADEIWKKLENTYGKEEISLKRQISATSDRSRPKARTSSIGYLSDDSSDPESTVKSVTNLYYDQRKTEETNEEKNVSNLVEEEFVEIKSVKYDIYVYYIKSIGIATCLCGMLAYFLFQSSTVGSNIILALWSDDENASNNTAVRDMYLGGYGLFGGLQSILTFIAIIIMTFGTIKASIKLHTTLLENILKAPMSFFDTTPTGRIVNRFSRDIDEVDLMLPMHVKDVLNQFFTVVGLIFILLFVAPIILILLVPLVIFFLFVQSAYLRSSRQLKRLMAINRSPMNSHLEESLSGAMTIRAFGFQKLFMAENEEKIENFQRSQYPEVMSNGWLFLRLQSIGTVLVVVSSLIIVINRDSFDPGLVGLCLSYTVNCQLSIYLLTRFTADMEKSIVSVERIKEYQETPQEAAFEMPGIDPPPTWPVYGNITFDRYSTRYRAGLDLVLNEITCDLHGGEKIGIVGRTGAGKSSITLSLFRIIEAASGSINIDGVNIADIGLTRLRSALTIIPQDPVLFSGTLRFNLDPFSQYTDQEVWKSLRLAHLSDMAHQLQGGLDHVIAEGGANLSVGQRQLVCLVRALLRKTRILVLDEATAAIDLETDDLIQSTIRNEFSDCTVLTIAHRIKTILDSSRVMVMEAGQIREFEDPAVLLKNKKSAFYLMAKDAGIVN